MKNAVIARWEGETLTSAIQSETFVIGTGAEAHLRLTGEDILAAHVRLVTLMDGGVLFINLAPNGNTLFNDKAAPPFKPLPWQKGIKAQIGEYNLELIAEDMQLHDSDNQDTAFDALVNEIAMVQKPFDKPLDFHEEDNGTKPLSDEQVILPDEPPRLPVPEFAELPLIEAQSPDIPIHPVALPRLDEGEVTPATGTPAMPFPPPLPELPADIPDDDATPAEKVSPSFEVTLSEKDMAEEVSAPAPHDDDATPIDNLAPAPMLIQPVQLDMNEKTQPSAPIPFPPHDIQLTPADSLAGEYFTTVYNGAIPATNDFPTTPNPAIRDNGGAYLSMPHDWHNTGGLSLQLPLPAVSLATRERARVPFSVRNENPYPADLQLFVTGLPHDWVTLPQASIKLLPGETALTDFIIEAIPPIQAEQLEGMIRVTDIAGPELSAARPFTVLVKAAPNLVGWLEPERTPAPGTTYLHLQNHTLATARTFITAGGGSGLAVIPAQAVIDLAAGGSAQIPLTLQSQRSLFRRKKVDYWVSAQQGSRAPLDFSGQAIIQPRLPIIWLIVLLLLFVLVCGAVSLGGIGSSVINALRPSETPTATATPSPSATSTLPPPTPVPSSTPIPPPASTVPPFNDPRPASCQSPIPANWRPYVVKAGDNLFRLAMNRGTTVEEITRINCLGGTLLAGAMLLLPG